MEKSKMFQETIDKIQKDTNLLSQTDGELDDYLANYIYLSEVNRTIDSENEDAIKTLGQNLVNRFYLAKYLLPKGYERVKIYFNLMNYLNIILNEENIEESEKFDNTYHHVRTCFNRCKEVIIYMDNDKKEYKEYAIGDWLYVEVDIIVKYMLIANRYFMGFWKEFINHQNDKLKEVIDIMKKYLNKYDSICSIKVHKFKRFWNTSKEYKEFYSHNSKMNKKNNQEWKITWDENKKSPLFIANKDAPYLILSDTYLNKDGTLKFDIDYKEYKE